MGADSVRKFSDEFVFDDDVRHSNTKLRIIT